MLTLIEPPGAKRGAPPVSRSQHQLLGLAGDEDDDGNDLNDFDGSGDYTNENKSFLQKVGGLLVGKSNSGDFSERWKRKFSERPSWCDADLALQQIKRGKAAGNRAALYSRSFIQKVLFSLGSFVQRRAFFVIFTVVLLFGICGYGLQFVRIETDIVKLWVAKGGRLDEELNFLSGVEERETTGDEVKRENGLGGGYQVVIQVPREEGQNILNKKDLLEHVTIMEQIATYNVQVGGVNWTLSDICFKPPSPQIDNSPFASHYIHIIERIVPCIWITPIDCFWEGSKAIGPHPSVETRSLGFAKEFLDSLPSADTLSWSNINPDNLIEELGSIFSLGNLKSFFYRAGIGKGYLDRWCIDPLDPQCPIESPNHFPFCDLIQRFLDYAEKNGIEVPVDSVYLENEAKKNPEEFGLFDMFGRKKRDLSDKHLENRQTADDRANFSVPSDLTNGSLLFTSLRGTSLKNESADFNHNETFRVRQLAVDRNNQSSAENAVSNEQQGHTSTTAFPITASEKISSKERATRCRKYAQPFADWMNKNMDKWHELLSENEFPVYPDYGKIMNGGCHGFAKSVMSWPQDLIIGGVKETEGRLSAAEALQSVFLVASPNDVYLRFKDASKSYLKPDLNLSEWNVNQAEKVVTAWQRKFTQSLYNHEFNFEKDSGSGEIIEHRRIHPLASTSIADMLEEFCQFNYTIIVVGYLLMLVYAVQSQMKLHDCKLATDSCMGLAFAGVLTVTFASVSGLGLATWFGIEFNAATTQIVPFLTLGIGVDNMFLLLHNYHGIVEDVKKNEIGMLMKETGMSVVMTSFNNILSFLAGTILPIPALRSFCAQSSILLTFNLIAILTIYPAIISLDLRRRKSSRRDIFCCFVAEDAVTVENSYTISIGIKPHIQEKKTVGDTVPVYHNLYSISDRDDDVEDDVKPWTLQAFLRNYYVPFLKRKSTKILVLLVCTGMFSGGIVGMYRASYGLELSDVLPEHTAPAAFLKARDKYFSFYPMFAVLKGPHIDYPNVQNKINNYRNSIARSKYIVKVEGEPSEKYWLALMRSWLSELQEKLDAGISAGKFDIATGNIVGEKPGFKGLSTKLTLEENIGYRLICSYGKKYNCTGRLGKVRFVDPSSTINAEGFYNYVTAWYNLDSMMYHVSQASFVPAPPRWSVEWENSEIVPPALPFAYSQIPFYLTGLTDTPVIVDMIKEVRATCDKFNDEGLPNFPSGIAFTFWEQYMHLSLNLIRAIGVIALSVFFVISIILLNPWAAGIIMVILVLMTVELAGFLGLAGIKMNPVSAVTIITAVGIGVEFTAHVVLSFLTSLGTRNARMAACIDRVFVPVIHGALSTLLGIIMLAFSEFEFVIKYFFVVMSALIAIGVVNGLVLLPVLLSLIGPNSEVTPVDGSARLSPPPAAIPKKKRKRNGAETQTHRRNISDDSNTATLGPEISSTVLLLDPARSASHTGSRVNAHARSVSAHINAQGYASGAHYESLNC